MQTVLRSMREKLQRDTGSRRCRRSWLCVSFGLENVELKSGIDIVLNAIQLDKELKNADIVVTGEGRLDGQSAMGKVPVGVAKAGRKTAVK